MYHNDKLSVFFEEGRVNSETAPAFDEYPLPRGDTETENTSRVIFSIKPRTPLRVILKLREGFNLFDTDGLRVTMAIGREYYSPDDVQSWWIPYEHLLREEDAVIGWESFWVWNSETASQGARKITAPPPPKGAFRSTPCNEWADIMQAAPGCIAVYVTRGTLPRKPVRGSKRCKTDPPESKVFEQNVHPIRSERFRPLAGEAGETYIFEAANVDQNTLNTMGLRTLPGEAGN